MSFSVSIHPPKTPITAGSGGVAKATIPNVCKMPGPPAPFVPSPLPNIAKSGNSPDGYSTSVKIEGEAIAIRGATFQSTGDEASKGTGGGLISANTQGIAKFILPGTMDVKIEGKGVHLKGDQVLNNCASGGSPPNTGATMSGADNPDGDEADPEELLQDIVCECNKHLDQVQSTRSEKANCRKLGEQKHDCCNDGINRHNADGKSPKLQTERGYGKDGAHDPSATRKWERGLSPEAYFKGISGKMFPDAAILDSSGNVDQFVEFKFQCPPGTPTRANAKPSAGTAVQGWTPANGNKPSQLDRTITLGASQSPKVTKEPMLLTNEKC